MKSIQFNRKIFVCVLWALVCVGVHSALAQMPPGPPPEPKSETKTVSKASPFKKHWWQRRTPDKPTASEQLEYGIRLWEQGRLRSAASAFVALVYHWPQAPEAPVAQLNYARVLEQREKWARAFEEYQYLFDSYAGFFPFEDVMERQYKIADSIATRNRYFLFFRFHTPEDAIPLFEKLIQNGMQWKRAAELQFRIARLYETSKQYDLAIDAYSVYLQRYPASQLAEQAGFSQCTCCYQYAKQYPNASDLRENALATMMGFQDRFPKSAMVEGVRVYQKELTDQQVGALYQQADGYRKTARLTSNPKAKATSLKASRICYQRVLEEYPRSDKARSASENIQAINSQLEMIHDK